MSLKAPIIKIDAMTSSITPHNTPDMSFSGVEVGSGNGLELSCGITCTKTYICKNSHTKALKCKTHGDS